LNLSAKKHKTDEFLSPTIVETVGEYDAERNTISVRIAAHRNPDQLFVQPLSVMPADLRERAKSSGVKFWAKVEITVESKQGGAESLKISDIELMKQ